MIEINLIYNHGFKWNSLNKNHIYIKGFIFDAEDNLLQGNTLLEYCKGINDVKTFKERILGKKGNYAIIIQIENELLIAVDAVRTFPLFYMERGGTLIVSDSCDYLKKSFNLTPNTNKAIETEFLVTGFVTRNKTLLNDVYQLQSGEFIRYSFTNGIIEQKFYIDYLTTTFTAQKDEKYYEKSLIEILDKSLNRMLQFADGRPFLVPLSGGYDSRLIVCMLKQQNIENVICYTYGTKNSHEVLTSQKVAKALNYRWIFIEYNEDTIPGDYCEDDDFKRYFRFASNYVSVFLLQDYFAIKQIKEKRMVPKNCVVVPGHSGDFLAGSHLSKRDIKNTNREYTIQRIRNKHYTLKSSVNLDISLSDYLNQVSCKYEYAVDDNWNFKERQAKFIVNSIRIYEFFGFEHYLLFWDQDLIDFFKELPPKYKYKTALYIKVIFSNYFNPLSVDFQKENSFLKNILKKLLPRRIKEKIKLKATSDFNKTGLMKKPLLTGMKDKYYKNINSIIAEWYINKLNQ